MADVNIIHNDPQGRLAAVPLLDETIRAAAQYIDRYVVFRGVLDIAVNVESTSTGRFAGNGDTAYAGQRDGRDIWEASMIAESRQGVDPDPVKPDFTIYIDPSSSYLAHLWWDPNIAAGLQADVPIDRTDAFSVVVHELLHGMGITGWRDIETGALAGNFGSVWDSLVTVSGGRAVFTGPATVALLGQPVEVRLGGSQGAFHLGNGPALSASQMPWVEGSNVNSYYYYDGERYTLGRLELALLQDVGWTLETSTTLTDVVNRWDDRLTPLYMVGYDSDEQLTGDVLADRIEGRAGNDLLVGLDGDDVLDGGSGNDTLRGGNGDDTLSGGAGNDVFDGGAGNDTAVYSSVRSAYIVAAAAGGYTISGPDGQDSLSAVESVRFADGSFALRGLLPNNPPSGTLQVNGTPRAGYAVQASSTLSDADGLGSLTYRWQSSADGVAWSDIAGARSASFAPQDPQVGLRLRVVAGYTDGAGHAESVTSSATAPVYGTLIGSAAADTLQGGTNAEIIEALGGADRITGGGGSDQIDGGAGIDTAVYAQQRSAYGIEHVGSDWTVRADASDEGSDTLRQVERLRFADTSIALDVDGNAGTVARIIGAVFGASRAADGVYVGIGLGLADAGTSALQLAQLALDARLGAAAPVADVVTTLYTNVVGVAPGTTELQYFGDLVRGGAYTTASLAWMAAQTELEAQRIDLTGLAAHGIAYLPA